MSSKSHIGGEDAAGEIAPTNLQVGPGMRIVSAFDDGRSIHCRIFGERLLDAVEIIDEDGASIELPPHMVDLAWVSKLVGMKLEI